MRLKISASPPAPLRRNVEGSKAKKKIYEKVFFVLLFFNSYLRARRWDFSRIDSTVF